MNFNSIITFTVTFRFLFLGWKIYYKFKILKVKYCFRINQICTWIKWRGWKARIIKTTFPMFSVFIPFILIITCKEFFTSIVMEFAISLTFTINDENFLIKIISKFKSFFTESFVAPLLSTSRFGGIGTKCIPSNSNVKTWITLLVWKGIIFVLLFSKFKRGSFMVLL